MRRWILGLPLIIAAGSETAQAQSTSLYGAPEVRPPLSLSQNSWYYVPPEPVRQIQLNDIITVVVKENSQVVSEGQLQRRTQSNVDARLRNWIQLRAFSLYPLPTSVGEPRARGSLDSQANTTTELQTQDLVTFRIAARVVDVRPNGHLVIEAHRTVRDNEEVWEKSLTGIVRREDVAPDNTVLSERIIELQIDKREAGHVYDSYKRGWLLRAMDRFKPL